MGKLETIDLFLKRREKGIEEKNYRKIFSAEMALVLPDLWNTMIKSKVYSVFDNDDEKFYSIIACDCLQAREIMFGTTFKTDEAIEKEIELMKKTIMEVVKNICKKGNIEFKGFRKCILFFPELEEETNVH